MNFRKAIQISVILSTVLGMLLTFLVFSFEDRAKATYFAVGYGIFLFSIVTTYFSWRLIVGKKQVALGAFLIVSKYLTFFAFMIVLMRQNWPASAWLIAGFVVSKIFVLGGYFIFKQRFENLNESKS